MDLFDMTVEGLDELERYQTEADIPSEKPSSPNQPERDQAGRVTSLSSAGDHKIVASLARTFERFRSTQEFLILGVQTDVLFPITLQRELAEAIRSSSSNLLPHQAPTVTYFELHSPFGHDTFLIDLNGVGGGTFFFEI
jgi:homoserine O-acetyltransferase